MELICIKKCKTIHNEPYEIGSIYSYYNNDFLDGLNTKYYPLYDSRGFVIGYQNWEFIEENFIDAVDYNQELDYVDKVFNFFMDNSIRVTNFHPKEKISVDGN